MPYGTGTYRYPSRNKITARGQVGRAAPSVRRRKTVVTRRTKRVYKSKGGRFSRASKAVIRTPSGLADATFVKLKYKTVIGLVSTSGALSTYVFRGNSIFDPDSSGIGHQPYFTDQWDTMYDDYIVLGSSIKVESFNTSGQTNASLITVVPSTAVTTFGSTASDQMAEQPYAKSKVGMQNADVIKIKSYMTTQKIYGLPKMATQIDPNFGAAFTASPVTQWYWHIGYNTLDQSTTQAGQWIEVTLMYYCRLHTRQRPAIS